MSSWKSIAWFLAKFAVAAGILFWLWSNGGWADAYGTLVLGAVRLVAPLLTGYQLETHPTAAFVHGETHLPLPLNLRETCAGIVPFAALVLATTGRTIRARLQAAAVGFAILYPVQVLVVAMTPVMMTPHEEWISRLLDVVYTFAALGGLVALPLFLWWMWLKLTEPAFLARATPPRAR